MSHHGKTILNLITAEIPGRFITTDNWKTATHVIVAKLIE